MSATVGRHFGNYAVQSLIGEGGMGSVYAAEHRFLGTRVAIKILHGTFANNPNVTTRFFQEAKSALDIGHPNIIEILDFGQTTDGELYLAMELLEGRSLAAALASDGAMPEAAAARIGIAIADALAAAHARGIVHRDLKPENVFLTVDGHVKVLDFGIAKIGTSAAGTKTGSLLGTPKYMAPEQAKGSKHVGPHTDVYALGAMLFEMLTGQPPFSGEDVAELLTKQLFEEPARPSSLVPVSPVADELVLQCLAKQPEKRPTSMIELRDRLQPLAERSPSAPTLPPLVRPQPRSPAPAHTTMSGAASELRDEIPRHRIVSGKVAIATGAVAVVAVAALVLRPHASPPAPVRTSAPINAPAPATAPTSSPLVELKLVIDPPDARVELDGVATTANPIKLPRSDAAHRLVVSAPGRVTAARELRPEFSGEVAVALAPERARTHPKATTHRRRIQGPLENDL